MAIKEENKRITITLRPKDFETLERIAKLTKSHNASKCIQFALDYFIAIRPFMDQPK